MPLYLFKHPDREEYIESSFSMEEEKSYTDKLGIEWIRVFSFNVAPPNRSLDLNRPIYDKKGNQQRVVPLSDEFIRRQGFNNAADYIEWNNSQVNEDKTPSRNLERAHENVGKEKQIKEMIAENQYKLKQNNKTADSRKPSKSALKISAQSNSSFRGKDQSSEKEYDKFARQQKYKSVKVESTSPRHTPKKKK